MLEGVIGACCDVCISIEFPRMDDTCHWRDGAILFQVNNISQVLVIGEGVFLAVIDSPPCIGAPKQISVSADGSVQVECRREVGESEVVVEIEGRRYYVHGELSRHS